MSGYFSKKEQTQKLVLGAVFSALVFIMQLLGSFIRFGPFSVSLVLVPIVVGAALSGYEIGAWLGCVFGFAVFASGDANAFFAIHPLGTFLTVMLKGLACGVAAAIVYKALSNKNRYLAVMAAAVVCPIVNTGIFLLGCRVFFMNAITEWAVAGNFENVVEYMFIGLAGGNFIFEMISNIILAPVILRVISFKFKS